MILCYTYNALGRRSQKYDAVSAMGEDYVRYYYNQDWQVLMETDEYDSALRTFIYGRGLDEVLVMNDADSGDDYFYINDHLKSPVVILEEDADIVERYEYDAYGKPTYWDGDFDYELEATLRGNPYYFTGRRIDFVGHSAWMIQYNRNRFYDYYTGCWLNQDPIGYQDGVNLYAYVNSNPVNKTDPRGLRVTDLEQLESHNRPRTPTDDAPNPGWTNEEPGEPRIVEDKQTYTAVTDNPSGSWSWWDYALYETSGVWQYGVRTRLDISIAGPDTSGDVTDAPFIKGIDLGVSWWWPGQKPADTFPGPEVGYVCRKWIKCQVTCSCGYTAEWVPYGMVEQKRRIWWKLFKQETYYEEERLFLYGKIVTDNSTPWYLDCETPELSQEEINIRCWRYKEMCLQ